MNYAKLADLNAKTDEVVTTNDVTVLVDPKATFYIAGTVMDFEVRTAHLICSLQSTFYVLLIIFSYRLPALHCC